VTNNVRHFAPDRLAEVGLLVQTPDEFLVHQWWLDPEGVGEVLASIAASTSPSALSATQVLDSLRRFARVGEPGGTGIVTARSSGRLTFVGFCALRGAMAVHPSEDAALGHSVTPGAEALSTLERYDRGSRACSSADRASASGA
jgi:hypothetical protein